MTPRTLFAIILKTLGVFFVKDILISIPQLASALYYFSDFTSGREALLTLFFTSLSMAVYILVSYYLIFKTGYIIDKLKLAEGFNEETLALNISTTTIVEIALIVTAAFILTNEIPNLCRLLFSYFQEKRMTFGHTKPDISLSAMSAVQILLAVLMLGERKKITAFVLRKVPAQKL